MPDHASPTRRELLRSASRLLVGAGAGVAAVAAGRSGLDPVARATGAGPTLLTTPATALDEAERLGPSGKIPFPLVGFGAGDIVCLNDFGTCRRNHQGVDIGELRVLTSPVQVIAVVDAVVTQVDRIDGGRNDNPGRFVVIHGDDLRWYRFHHLDQVTEGLAVGDRVTQGDVLGTMGSSGDTAWPHLHFEVWTGDGAYSRAGTVHDPVPLMAIPPTVELRDRLCTD